LCRNYNISPSVAVFNDDDYDDIVNNNKVNYQRQQEINFDNYDDIDIDDNKMPIVRQQQQSNGNGEQIGVNVCGCSWFSYILLLFGKGQVAQRKVEQGNDANRAHILTNIDWALNRFPIGPIYFAA
jgi:hypothetical protein